MSNRNNYNTTATNTKQSQELRATSIKKTCDFLSVLQKQQKYKTTINQHRNKNNKTTIKYLYCASTRLRTIRAILALSFSLLVFFRLVSLRCSITSMTREDRWSIIILLTPELRALSRSLAVVLQLKKHFSLKILLDSIFLCLMYTKISRNKK